MANEITMTSSLRVLNGNQNYAPPQTSKKYDQSTAGGPVPGTLSIGTAGEDITFTDLSTPAVVRMKNLDATNFVEYGIWDGSTFHELGELLPGQETVLRFSRNMTGFRMKADTGACRVEIDAFEA